MPATSFQRREMAAAVRPGRTTALSPDIGLAEHGGGEDGDEGKERDGLVHDDESAGSLNQREGRPVLYTEPAQPWTAAASSREGRIS